ncbi:ankyrin repeat domain-containing protein 50 [Microdochium nivale]|nr:ankyrin repeat domain-containing protein 50 [Microdochium nivale]
MADVPSTTRRLFLADLPSELLPFIVVYLSTQDALALAATSRYHHEALCDRIYARHIRTEFDGDYPLVWAAGQLSSSSSEHALATARRALAHGADPNAHVLRSGVSVDRLCHTPLLKAAGEGCAAMVRLLLEHGADPCAHGEYFSPLQLAAARGPEGGYLACLRLMLSPADPAQRARIANHRTSGGRTALHTAAVRGSSDFVRVLLEHEAEVDMRSVDGKTALHFAIEDGYFDTAAILVEAGADPLALCIDGGGGPDDKIGVNALDKALSWCSRATFELPSEQNSAEYHEGSEFLKFLLARYRKSTADGSRTRVHLPPGRAHLLLHPREGPLGTAPFIKMLLEAGLDPDSRSEPGGTTPLWEYAGETYATSEDAAAAAAIATALLDAGASIEFRDPETGHTPLMRAAPAGNSSFVIVLLSRGADVLQLDDEARQLVAGAARDARDPVLLRAMRRLQVFDDESAKDSGEAE